MTRSRVVSPLRNCMQGLEDELRLRFENWHGGVGRGAGTNDIEAACLAKASSPAARAISSTDAGTSSTVDKCSNDSEVVLPADHGDPATNSIQKGTPQRRKRSQSAELDDTCTRTTPPAANASAAEILEGVHTNGFGANDLERHRKKVGAVLDTNGSRSDVNGRGLEASRMEASNRMHADGEETFGVGTSAAMEGVESSCVLEPCKTMSETIRSAFEADRAVVAGQLGRLTEHQNCISKQEQSVDEDPDPVGSACAPFGAHVAVGTYQSGGAGVSAGKSMEVEGVNVATDMRGNASPVGRCSPTAYVVAVAETRKGIDAVSVGISEADICERPDSGQGGNDATPVRWNDETSTAARMQHDLGKCEVVAGMDANTDVLACHDLAGAVNSLDAHGQVNDHELEGSLGVEK